MWYIGTNTTDSFNAIRDDLVNFIKAPQEAVYYALDEFCYGLVYSKEVKDEAFKFYSGFYKEIWEEEIEKDAPAQKAFKEWEEEMKRLVELRNYFEDEGN